jgi:hypothetical protein
MGNIAPKPCEEAEMLWMNAGCNWYFKFFCTVSKTSEVSCYHHRERFFFPPGVGWDWVHLVCQPLFGLLYQPWMIDDFGAVGGMKIGRGHWSTRRKPAPVPLCPPQIPLDLGSNPGRCGGRPATNPLSYGTAFISELLDSVFNIQLEWKSLHLKSHWTQETFLV